MSTNVSSVLSERERPQPLAVSASKPFGEEASAQGATRSEAKEHYDTSDTKMKYEYEYETYCEYMLEPKCANTMLMIAVSFQFLLSVLGVCGRGGGVHLPAFVFMGVRIYEAAFRHRIFAKLTAHVRT